MEYKIYNKTKIRNYGGCQCFNDCDCWADYPKKEVTKMIEINHNGTILRKQLPSNITSEGGRKNFALGMIQSHDAKIKRENKA